MTLQPGARLGPYEVIGPLGAGGMGEVYRARDARLGRDVALKVLPAAYAAHADRLARFEQEARAIGALNHPNILAIHDIGAHQGIHYLVSELLEGQTLRQRLAQGPMPVRKATELLAQAARGLAAAHDRGVVHRDLKPENLFVTRDGRMKILDFGLAKLAQPEVPAGTLTNLPTTPAGTGAGVILGTVGYMAPEQARGQPADARSDLFALGAVLYETLTGKRAFPGDSAVEVLHAILKDDPPGLASIDPSLPASLDPIVRHCLEKNPEERYQTARDVAFSLESLAGAVAATGTPGEPVMHRPKRRAWLAAGAVLVAAAGVVTGILVGPGMRGRPDAGPPSFHRLTFRHGFIHTARFANGGRNVVYAAAWDGRPIEVFLAQPGSPEARSLGLPGMSVLAVSPTDELAVCRISRLMSPNLYRAVGTLARVPLNGGSPRDLADSVMYADWSPDGSRLAAVRNLGDRRRLEYPLGTLLYESPHDLLNPRISPDGKRVALWEGLGRRYALIVVDEGGTARTLSPGWNDWWYLAWSPDGKEIWYGATSSGHLSEVYAVDLEGRRRTLYAGPGAYDVHDIAADGRALLGSVKQRDWSQARLGRWDGPRNLSWFDGTQVVDMAADGTALLLSESSEAGGSDEAVYLQREDGSPPIRLGHGRALALSPDGRTALAARSRRDLVLLPIGAGAERPLAAGLFETVLEARWLPDGRRIAVLGSFQGRTAGLFLVDVDGGQPTQLADVGYEAGGYQGYTAVSPDGGRIAAVAADGRIALVPVTGGAATFDDLFHAGDGPIAWSDDGSALYVLRREDAATAAIDRIDLRERKREVWKDLPIAELAGVSNVSRVAMTSDGRAWAWTWQQIKTDLYLVEGLR